MGGRGQALQDPRLCEEQAAGANGHECPFLAGVGDLQFREGRDQGKWFGLGFEDFVDAIAAGDDEDVILGEVLVGSSKVDIGFDSQAGGRADAGGRGGDGDFEGLGACSILNVSYSDPRKFGILGLTGIIDFVESFAQDLEWTA